MPDEGPGIRVVHFDGYVAQRPGGAGQLPQRRFIARVEPLHVADLQHRAGQVARGDHLVDVVDAVAERLFAIDMQAFGEGRQHLLAMQGVRRSDHHRIQRQGEQPVEIVEGRKPEFFADEGADLCGRIVDACDLELALELQQIGNVLDLGNATRSDHPHLDALHAGCPGPGILMPAGLSLALLWFHC